MCEMNINDLKTGDLLLFDCENYFGTGILSYLIKKYTDSKYSHIGMVVKDPEFTEKPMPKGYYVWQSGWTGDQDLQDGKKKFGVQLTHLDEMIDHYKENKGHIYIRKVHCDEKHFSNETLDKIHKVVYDKPYDINLKDWIQAMDDKDSDPQKVDRFWCSALVGYIYTKSGILSDETDWSVLKPCDFSIEYNDNLEFTKDCSLDSKEIKLF